MLAFLRKKIQSLLKSIADQNKAQFGTQKMDCCDLNKKPKPKQ